MDNTVRKIIRETLEKPDKWYVSVNDKEHIKLYYFFPDKSKLVLDFRQTKTYKTEWLFCTKTVITESITFAFEDEWGYDIERGEVDDFFLTYGKMKIIVDADKKKNETKVNERLEKYRNKLLDSLKS